MAARKSRDSRDVRVPGIIKRSRKNHALMYLKEAREAYSNKDVVKAFENFVLYFDCLENPLKSTKDIQAIFTSTVCTLGNVLDDMCSAGVCEIEDLIKCYVRALNIFPDNYLILNHFGSYMFKISEVGIARRYLEKAVEVNKDYLPSEINLMHVKWQQIPRWHYRMLNDKRRNLAYDRAIEEHVNQGFKNVVDIGSGTGLLALSALKHEGVKATTFEENKCLASISKNVFDANNVHNVKIYAFNSVTQPVSEEKFNLIVTEIFDVALFGEKALETILHALTVLRAPGDFRIIPCRAKVYITGISSTKLQSKHECISSKSLELLKLQNVRITEHDSEPYEAELLSQLDVTYLTHPLPIMDINFSDPHQILDIIGKDKCSKEMHLKCLKEGTLHAFALWFDLHLTDNISLTTNPLSDECVTCWEQAVIYLDRPVQVKEGQILRFTYAVRDSKLCVEHIYDEEDPKVHLKVSKEIISFLNDDGLVDCMVRLADKLQGSIPLMVDCNVVPILGILLAKDKKCMIYHLIKRMEDRDFVNYILSQNDIPEEIFTLASEVEFNKPIDWLVFFDVVSIDGSLEYFAGKHMTDKYLPKIPQRVTINVQLIHSPYIDRCNKVMDENVLDFRIGEFINEYAGYEHPNLEKFDYSEHSEPVRFLRDNNVIKAKADVVVTKGGLVNAMYVWYDLQFYNDIVYSTKNSTYYKKTCFFLSSPKTVEVGDILCIKMHLQHLYLKFSL